ncbi:MAG: AsmA family protein [Alphaproteobacteria bacterium]|nr:AsmA family protein [Alphaproteobacteria bacterium]
MFKKLLKFILKTLAWLIGLLVILATIGYLTINFWIKPLISYAVPKITKTTAVLESADISPLSGRITLKGLKIGNPAGFTEPYIFELGEFAVQFQPKTILSNKIIVDSVLIKGTQITAEINKNAQTNLLALNENVQSVLNSKTQTVPTKQNDTQKTPSKSQKSVVIKDLQILDTTIRFAVMGHSSSVNLPNIQEKNIGEKKNMSLKQTFQLLVDKLTLEPIKEMQKATQNALKDALNKISERAKENKNVKTLSNVLSNIF